MHTSDLECLEAEISNLSTLRSVGRVTAVAGQVIRVEGLSATAKVGDRIRVFRKSAAVLSGEVLTFSENTVSVLPDGDCEGVSLGDRVLLENPAVVAPCDGWIGRIVDPYGRPLDGRSLPRGSVARDVRGAPPAPARRRGLGPRLETGLAVFNTFLPIARGQRLGLFAGSGVGKSNLLGQLGRMMQADVVVFALIGERGRELREFVDHVLGADGLKRSILVAATSDQSPLTRRRCAWTAMTIAEHFRDQGKQVLFLADSVTRFAEAHREVSVAAGELPALRGYPASTAHTVMSLCERAGPGEGDMGDITALFSVLVAGSDMEEPIADILRGVLDGHVVLDRQIAERGRFPAVDLLRSVSRSLPRAATDDENVHLMHARRLLGAYARSETMVRAGLYVDGSDPELDQAIRISSDLDAFLAEQEKVSSENSFSRLGLILRRASQSRPVQAKTVSSPASQASPTRRSNQQPGQPRQTALGDNQQRHLISVKDANTVPVTHD